MKNAQNEYEKPAESSLSSTTTATATAAATTATTTTVVQPLPSFSVSPSSPIGISQDIVKNVHKINATAAITAAHATKMTDEQNNENNNDNNSRNSVNNNGNLIAEAAKILLKNGLNGTSAAAAALLTAATSFQLPSLPLPITTLATTATSTLFSHSAIDCAGNQLDPPPAHVASSSKISTTMSSAITVGHVIQRNNGLPSPTSNFKVNTKDICLTTPSGLGAVGKSMSTNSSDAGVIDYTLGATSNGTPKILSTTSTLGNIGAVGCYPPGGGGGRLQFFKDGKFILELARSKDGERGGWVSVPRKHFRQPSATTSTVTPASTANACAYPKIESSTSLSFSDDNSSIQSSPWQRDHCWKQTTPKRNISKEMAVYFRLTKNVTLTKAGLRLAKRKRRRPYDDSINTTKGLKLFERCNSSSDNKKSIFSNDEKDFQSQFHRLQNGNSKNHTKNEEEDHCSTSSIATLVGENDTTDTEKATEKTDAISLDTEKSTKTESLSLVESTENIIKSTVECKAETKNNSFVKEKINVKNETDEKNLAIEEMSTSEDGDVKMLMARNESQQIPETSTSSISKVASKTVDVEDAPTLVQPMTGVEEKRLNKRRVERAKLTSIVQKLIDRMPARASISAKVPLSNNTSIVQNNNFLTNKVSPCSSSSTSPSLLSTSSASATASRLVEFHHQQHVSPRKRILREFEKVSLEDTTGTCGAGGKRSRAKGSASSSMSAHNRNARSPNNRVQSSVCSIPTVSAGSLSISTTPSNGESLQSISVASAGVKHTKNIPTTNAQPTRLYSSYSIHSLLGDQSNSGSSGSSSTSGAPKKCEQPGFVSNLTYQHNQHQHSTEHSSYVRKSVSPKSPDAGGGKSPSSNAANKKRSPPYASPMHESLSRSPSVSNSVDYSPRATPPEFSLTTKQRYGTPSASEQQPNLLQHHRQLQQGAFYSPYMMSPKYVPGSTNIATESASPPSTSRSPRQSTAAFTSPTTSTTMSTANQQNIPNTYSSHLAPPPQRELSPSHSLVDFPRESTPRTVPKKTASIRRQFASPTASSHNTTNSSTSCSSPSERSSEELTSDCKTSSNVTSAAYQQLLQRNSPSSSLSSPLHAAAYYMYPPAAPISFGSSNSGSSLGASGSSPIAHAAQTSAYIPSCYHSYLSALNITKHFYMGAGASQSAAARLSSFHPMSIPYNGVNAAAVAAAAAAAAATAAFSGQPHMGHHPMLPPPSAATSSFYGVGSGFGVGLNASSLSTNVIPQTHKLTESNLAVMSTDTSAEATVLTSGTSTATTRSTQFSSNIKDEHSSDVPLNLSKH